MSEKEKEITSEEEVVVEKDEKAEFEKDSEVVSAGKYNQAVRKQREVELEKRRLEKELEEIKNKPVENSEKKDDEEDDDDSFFEGDEGEKKKEQPDFSKIIDEKIKPISDTLKKRDEADKKNTRAAFFEAHSEYRDSSEKWQELLDTMDEYINPNSSVPYTEQLEAAHRIISGDTKNESIEDRKKEIANDAASGGDGSQKGHLKEDFTAEDRKVQKMFNVSDEGMKAYKEKLESGSIEIL
jgi:hypothetical protein